ncbi:hypothetical protein [Streptomyces sp. NPDC058953]|uniref:hypothetical protein n=1 Tax=unclassified Streptomyces TaxID=2593676 RepID=UPI00369E673D
MNEQGECGECARLRVLLERAREARDKTLVTDCRVLLRRHPAHDGVPVTARDI